MASIFLMQVNFFSSVSINGGNTPCLIFLPYSDDNLLQKQDQKSIVFLFFKIFKAPIKQFWSLQKAPGFDVSIKPRLALTVYRQQSVQSGMYFEMYLYTQMKLYLDARITALYRMAALNNIGFYYGNSWFIAAKPYSNILLYLVGFLQEFSLWFRYLTICVPIQWFKVPYKLVLVCLTGSLNFRTILFLQQSTEVLERHQVENLTWTQSSRPICWRYQLILLTISSSVRRGSLLVTKLLLRSILLATGSQLVCNSPISWVMTVVNMNWGLQFLFQAKNSDISSQQFVGKSYLSFEPLYQAFEGYSSYCDYDSESSWDQMLGYQACILWDMGDGLVNGFWVVRFFVWIYLVYFINNLTQQQQFIDFMQLINYQEFHYLIQFDYLKHILQMIIRTCLL